MMDTASRTPTILVVFGATGDLMARKIVPSIFHLYQQNLLPERFQVIGFSRREWSDDDLRQHVRSILVEKYPDAGDVSRFVDLFKYQRGTFQDRDGYDALSRGSAAVADRWGVCANRLFYLAVPPAHYESILRNLAGSGLTASCDADRGYTRVLIEKPFGHDIQSSKELDELLASLLREEQIYRIDHYLAKELLQGILAFRFHNDLLESGWHRGNVESIEISLLENIGVEKRGAFYDGVGALRDVGQNHLLQMLALVTMEQPTSLDADAVRRARAALLESMRPLSADEVGHLTYRAQYEGYAQIDGVAPDSHTETYFRLRTTMTGSRWAGVPVVMESGKRVGEAPLKRIVVTFRHKSPCLCGEGKAHLRNKVVFTLEPDDIIRITLWAKRPGFDYEVEERAFEFSVFKEGQKLQYVEEYAKLIHDAVDGDQTAFVSTAEVRAMWAFIDPVLDGWHSGLAPLESYEPDCDDVVKRAEAMLSSGRGEHQVGVCGLGRMGAGIALNLLDNGWRVVGWNRHPGVAHAMESDGLVPADTLVDLVGALEPPRIVWLMVPAGDPVDEVLFGNGNVPALADLLEPGDIVIDGGNSLYSDDEPRALRLAKRGIGFLDCGTSGGPIGARTGACLMVGGDRPTFERAEPLFADLAVRDGYRFFDGVGTGHYVKMVHNGIEYGMMQAIAEGFELMHGSPRQIDLQAAADVYQRASVIESRLVGWLGSAFGRLGTELESVSGTVGHTGEGAWTVETAKAAGVSTPVIEAALRFRIESAATPSYAGKVLQALRNEFGGHELSPGHK